MYQLVSLRNPDAARGEFWAAVLWMVEHNIHILIVNYRHDVATYSELIIGNPIRNEVAVLFYASLVPTLWIWVFFFSVLISRMLIRVTPVLEFARYALDIDQHPMRSVGFIAALICAGICAVLLAF
jgi:hypothetical protein